MFLINPSTKYYAQTSWNILSSVAIAPVIITIAAIENSAKFVNSASSYITSHKEGLINNNYVKATAYPTSAIAGTAYGILEGSFETVKSAYNYQQETSEQYKNDRSASFGDKVIFKQTEIEDDFVKIDVVENSSSVIVKDIIKAKEQTASATKKDQLLFSRSLLTEALISM